MRTHYPVTISDCAGEQLTFDKAPQRVVTLDTSVTETLLSLGLADRIVGISLTYADDLKNPWPPTADAIKTLKVLSDPTVGWPSKEVLVANTPDLVTSTNSFAFDPGNVVASRDDLKKLGIGTYLTRGGCDPTEVWHDLSPLYQTIRDLGVIFDVQGRAESLIGSLESSVDQQHQRAVAAHLPNYAVGETDGYGDFPITNGVSGANAIIELAGSHDAFVDLAKTGVGSWEVFIDRNPQVLWMSPGDKTKDVMVKEVEASPLATSVEAVKKHRYVFVSYYGYQESPRIIDGLTQMVDELIAVPK